MGFKTKQHGRKVLTPQPKPEAQPATAAGHLSRSAPPRPSPPLAEAPRRGADRESGGDCEDDGVDPGAGKSDHGPGAPSTRPSREGSFECWPWRESMSADASTPNSTKNSRPKCPNCGTSKVAEILYGLPICIDKGKLDRGEIVLGGCCITGSDPKWHCNRCRHNWITNPSN